jgi:hypothetical protein
LLGAPEGLAPSYVYIISPVLGSRTATLIIILILTPHCFPIIIMTEKYSHSQIVLNDWTIFKKRCVESEEPYILDGKSLALADVIAIAR